MDLRNRLHSLRPWLVPTEPRPETSAAPTTEPGRELTSTLSLWWFLRLLGFVYLCAFASLMPQILGLCGSKGMMPAAPFLKAVAAQLGTARFFQLPTVFWFSASDDALLLVCGLGALCALAATCGRLLGPALLGCFVAYLSLVGVGRQFLRFQWDALLLEVGFLALFLGPISPTARRGPWLPPRLFRYLLLALLVRFMFAAGWAKLRSGDETWRSLTALDYHFETQPLPTVIGYYAHQLPLFLKHLSVVAMFFIELVVPFLIVIPRAWARRTAFAFLVGLQIAIAATGNYAFFNLLTAVMCVPLLPDRALLGMWPQRLRRLLLPTEVVAAPADERPLSLPILALRGLVFATLGLLLLVQSVRVFSPRFELPGKLSAVDDLAAAFHLSSAYGLFAHMTTERPELIIEGSDDGVNYRAYELRYKPGALERRPIFVAPHQPRLDWQLWFAALSSRERHPFIDGMCIRLLQGSPDVRALFAYDPFSGRTPRSLRILRYEYHMTSLAERRATGAYWKRGEPELYLSPVSLPESNR